MSACFDGTFAAIGFVFGFAAPENRLAVVVYGLEFNPHVEAVNGSAWEKVADFARADDDFQTHFVASAHGQIFHLVQRSYDFSRF
jgi:hypothetical protein